MLDKKLTCYCILQELGNNDRPHGGEMSTPDISVSDLTTTLIKPAMSTL